MSWVGTPVRELPKGWTACQWAEATVAEHIAHDAHAGRRRVGPDEKPGTGLPEISHVQSVAELCALTGNGDAVVVAWLHDVVEDAGERWSLRRLESFGFRPHILAAVGAITRREGNAWHCDGEHETYWAYLDRCAEDDLARVVKRADLLHNSFDEPRSGMRKRNEKALRIIAPDLFE